MSTDLEMLLRSTLAGRADTITYGPPWAGTDSLATAPGPSRNRRWMAVAAAAAAVIVIGAGVVALRDTNRRSTPPATNTPSPTQPAPTPTADPTPTGSPSPTRTTTLPTKVTELASCATALPNAWTNALQNSVVNVGGRTVWPLAVAPDKSLVVLRDDGVTPGSKREVMYVAPGGASSVVYNVKNPDNTTVLFARVSGPWLVLALQNAPRPPKNTVPGNTSIGVQGIVVVNLENLSAKLIAGTDTALTAGFTGPSTQSMAVSDGIVYWDEEKSYGDATGTLKSYNLSTGAQSDAYKGKIGYVTANAAGVGWRDYNTSSFVFAVRYQLPPVVRNAMAAFSEYRLHTDGTNYAWLGSSTDVYWWKPGLAKPVHLKLPTGVAINTDDMGGSVSVVGHLVIPSAGSAMVIDMQTGAVAPFPTNGLFGSQRGELIDNTGSVFDGLAFTGTAGHYENGYWADTATSALRVDIAGLPALTC